MWRNEVGLPSNEHLFERRRGSDGCFVSLSPTSEIVPTSVSSSSVVVGVRKERLASKIIRRLSGRRKGSGKTVVKGGD